MTSAALTKDVISFDPFSIVVSERLVTKRGSPIELGARSLDILIALLSRPNEAISKRDLGRCGPMPSRKKAVCGFTSPNCVRIYGRIKTSSRSDSTFAALRSRANCQPTGRAY
jgi:hypothetical protein